MYLDPGSGSLILQVLIASVLAIPFLLRSRLRRLVPGLARAPKNPNSRQG